MRPLLDQSAPRRAVARQPVPDPADGLRPDERARDRLDARRRRGNARRTRPSCPSSRRATRGSASTARTTGRRAEERSWPRRGRAAADRRRRRGSRDRARADPAQRVRARPHRRRAARRPPGAARRHGPRERADGREARRLGPSRLELQRDGHRRPPVRGGADDGAGRLRPPGPRHLLLVQGPRRARPLRGAPLARRDPDRAAAAAAAARAGSTGTPTSACPGIEANSGSLGMGISKGRGMAWAKRFLGRGGRVVVMVGRRRAAGGPELGGAAGRRARGDGQPDRDRRPQRAPVGQADRGDPRARRPRGEGAALRLVRRRLRRARPRPAAGGVRGLPAPTATTRSCSLAHTIKGKGVSFMEHPRRAGGGRRHVSLARRRARRRGVRARVRGADRADRRGLRRARASASSRWRRCRRSTTSRRRASRASPSSGAGTRKPKLKEAAEYVAEAYGEAVLDLAGRHPELVVLDADLASDCRVRGFELGHPERFIEVGIAEQDMVSMAAGLARQGLLPVVNSFASFLASRANEQIYNAASEGARIVYALPLRGPDPGRAGQVAPEPARRVAARRAAERHDRPARRTRRRRAPSSSGPSKTPPTASRSGSRSARRRAGSSCRRATSSSSGRGTVLVRRAPTPSCSRTGR